MTLDRSAQSRSSSLHVGGVHLAGVLLETYRYGPGPVEPLPAHAHAAFQLGLSLDCVGEYHYRGALQRVPPGALSVIQSGEPHRPSARRVLAAPATFRMLYVEPTTLLEAAAEVAARRSELPYIPALATSDPVLIAAFLQLHARAVAPASQLELDERLLAVLSRLHTAHTHAPPPRQPWRSDRRVLLRVREFLTEHAASNVSLRDLADLAGLSRYHLCRSFHHTFGVSPHAYHVQVRIDRAKRLLARNVAIADAARATGFADQSHFGRHFRRLVGISPGRYAQQRNNVPDT